MEKTCYADALPQDQTALAVFNTEKDTRNTQKVLVSKYKLSSQQHEAANPGCRKRTKFIAVLQSAGSKKRRKRIAADALPQDKPSLAVPTSDFFTPLIDIKIWRSGNSTG
jgi:hypothetical protein